VLREFLPDALLQWPGETPDKGLPRPLLHLRGFVYVPIGTAGENPQGIGIVAQVLCWTQGPHLQCRFVRGDVLLFQHVAHMDTELFIARLWCVFKECDGDGGGISF
jgi:hypothetical protein